MMRKMATDTVDITAALVGIQQRIKFAASTRKQGYREPCLVAVSKTKPVEMILKAYTAGQRHFGENYVQELLQKANDTKIQFCCPDIRWHFIGHLQRNKVAKLNELSNLWMVETVDSLKLAEAINANRAKLKLNHALNIMLEVNTSREQNKHGISPEDVVCVAGLIIKNCPLLSLRGLMTIGAAENSAAIRPNPDFAVLFECHGKVCSEFKIKPEELELSMGMSEDFEHAVEMGSSEVRVGSKIFGSRVYHSITDGDSGEDTQEPGTR